MEFPWDRPLEPGQFAHRNIGVVRLYIPRLFPGPEWFLYFDNDVIFRRGQFFPEVMSYTDNPSKVFFAVSDIVWAHHPSHRKRIRSYNARASDYFGSGFLLWRNGEILRREIAKSLEYCVKHMELRWPDQDALNLGFDWTYIDLLPKRFCVCSEEHGPTWSSAYNFHFAAGDKPRNPFLKSVVAVYTTLRDHYVDGHNLTDRSPSDEVQGHASVLASDWSSS
jgi:lipopolysaccharide biosynthesis glycosyltransferase